MQFSVKEAAMTTAKKAKQSAKKFSSAKPRAERRSEESGAIRKKAAKKTPLRPASRKKARPAKNAGKARSIGGSALEAVRPSPSRPATPVSLEQRIGIVTHYYSHLSVVAMQLAPGATLRAGDVIHIWGHTTDFTQKVESLEVNHAPVTEVGSKDDFGLKVIEHAREHDVVFKVQL
jgi:hypothetical protein